MEFLISILIVLVIIGVLLWLVNTVIPMDPKIRQIIQVVVVVFVLIWLLGVLLGGWPFLPHRVFVRD